MLARLRGPVNEPGADGIFQPRAGERPPAREIAQMPADETKYFERALAVLRAGAQKPPATETYEPVSWLYTVREARTMAAQKTAPFVVYVCDEQRYALAGEGLSAWEEYKQTHGGTCPEKTIFECAEVQQAFAAAGISIFVKLEHCAVTVPLMEKLKTAPNTLLFVAPNGEQLEKFSGEQCEQGAVRRYLAEGFANHLAAWTEGKRALAAIDADEAVTGATAEPGAAAGAGLKPAEPAPEPRE